MLAIDVETNGTELDAHLAVLQFGWSHDEAALDGEMPRSGTLEGVLGPEHASPVACCVHGIAPHVRKAADPRGGRALTPLELAVEMVTALAGHAQTADPRESWGYNSDRFDSRAIRGFALDHGQESAAALAAPANDLMALLQYAHWLQAHPDPEVRSDLGIALPLNERGLPTFALEAVARHFGFPFGGDAHRADADARQTLAVARHCAGPLAAVRAALADNRERARPLLEAAAESPHAPQPVGVGVVGPGRPYATGYRVARLPATAQGGWPAWKTTAPKAIERLLAMEPAALEGAMALPEEERKAALGAAPPVGVLYPGLMNLHWDARCILPAKRGDHAAGQRLLDAEPDRAQAAMEALFANGARVRRDPHPRRQSARRIGLSAKDAARLETLCADLAAAMPMRKLHAFNPFRAARLFDCPAAGQLAVGRKLADLKWRQMVASYPEPVTLPRMLSGVAALLTDADADALASRWLEAESWLRSLRAGLPDGGALAAGDAEVAREEDRGGRRLMGRGDMLRAVRAHNARIDELAGFVPDGPDPFPADGGAGGELAKAALGNGTGEAVRERAEALLAQARAHLAGAVPARPGPGAAP